MVEVRILGPADQAVLADVAPDVFDDALDLEATQAFLEDPRHHLVVAIDDGIVVGFVSAVHYVHPDKPAPELWINEVGVAPSHQRQGIGRAMLQTLLREASDLGCRVAWVLTDRANIAAMQLYASLDGVEAPTDHVMFNIRLKTD